MSAPQQIDSETAEDACRLPRTSAGMPSPSMEEALEDGSGSGGSQPVDDTADEPSVSSAAEPASPLDDGSPSSAVANDASPDGVSPEPESSTGQSVGGRFSTKTFVKCGTPGCDLPDFHDGPCSCHLVAGARGSRGYARPSSAAAGTSARPLASVGARAAEAAAAATGANGDDESSESGEEAAEDEGEGAVSLPSALACGDASFMLPKQPVLIRLRGPFASQKQPRPDGRLPTPTLLLGHPMSTIKQLLEVVHTWVVQHRNGHIDWAAVGAKMRPELSGDEAHRLWRGVAYNTPAAEASSSRRPPAHLASTTREQMLAAKMDDGDSDQERFEDYRAASMHNEQVLREHGEVCAGKPTPDRLPLWPQKGTPRIPGRAWPLPHGVAWPTLPGDGSGPLGLEGVQPPGRELTAQRNEEVWRDAPLKLPPPKPWKPDEDVKLVATVQRLGTRPPVRGEYEHIFKRSWNNVSKRLQELVKRGMLSAKALNPAAAQPLLTASAKAAATLPPWAVPTGPAPIRERVYKDGSALAPRQKPTSRDVPESLKEDEESVAVWTRAREVKDAGVDAEARIHGWRIVYELRDDNSTTKGDIYCLPPEAAEAPPSARARAPAPAPVPVPAEAAPGADIGEAEEAGGMRRPKRGAAEAASQYLAEFKAQEKKQRREGGGISKQTAIRSFVALKEVLEQRLQLRTTGKLWVPPAVNSLVEVEVADPYMGGDTGNEWRRGQVRKLFPDGRFQVCIYTRAGIPDEDFIEWYARQDEGKEWRRVDGQPDATKEPPPPTSRKPGGRGRGGRGSRSRGSGGGRGQAGCGKCRWSTGGCGMCAWKVHLAAPTPAAAADADGDAEMAAAAETGSETTAVLAAGTAMTD